MRSPHYHIDVQEGDYLLPREAVAILLGIRSQTLSKWAREPDPPPYDDEKKGYPARALGEWIRKKQTLRTGPKGSRPYLPEGVVISQSPVTNGLPSALPVKKDYNFEKTRKEAAAADKIEMENAVARGELVLAADVEKGWSDILSRVKTRMMQIPYSCAMMVAGMNDMSEIQEIMREKVRDALIEMSADWREAGEDDG